MNLQYMRVYYSLVFLVVLLSLCSSDLRAQSRYTYVEDFTFNDPTELFGYRFVPIEHEIPKSSRNELSPGDYSFGITANNVYLDLGGNKQVYNIQSINPTEFGFQITILNASNIAQAGHLKIVLDGKNQARALVFKPSEKTQEEIFHLAEIDEFTKEKEETHFTDIIDLPVDHIDSIWNKEVFPYTLVDELTPLRQVMNIQDSLHFRFYEELLITEKKKNLKDSFVNLETFDYKSISEDSLKALGDYIKVSHEQFVDFNEAIMQENGDYKMLSKTMIINKIDEKEDSTAKGLQERFMIEFQFKKSPPMYVFLTEFRTVSSIEYMGKQYKCRYLP